MLDCGKIKKLLFPKSVRFFVVPACGIVLLKNISLKSSQPLQGCANLKIIRAIVLKVLIVCVCANIRVNF